MKYLLVWPLANIRHRIWLSSATSLGVGVAAFLVSSLFGFVEGYQSAVERDVDQMGFDLLITAKGCPYEAATLMLRGGAGLRYMPEGVVPRIAAEPDVEAVYPTLIHPLRDPASPEGMILVKGVERDFISGKGLRLAAGGGLGEALGVVLGFEAAELEARRPGDPYLLPTESGPVEVSVLGILERTGTQVDGTVLMELGRLQDLFGLESRLTGVGVRVRPEARDRLEALQERYNSEPELQVVSLSGVLKALRIAMRNLEALVGLLAALVGLMALWLLVNAALLRSLADRRRMAVLRAIGFSDLFVGGAAVIETVILVAIGLISGLLATVCFGSVLADHLVSYLPYIPPGNLIHLNWGTVLSASLVGLGVAVLATVPAIVQLRWFTGVEALRDG